jgi:UDP-N-acetylglucosamine 4,6-dehydratase
MKEKIESQIDGKTILITGGTGSFGTAVTKRMLKLNPKKIVIFSRDEKKQFDMRNAFNNPKLRFVIGDIRDRASIDIAMNEGIDFVFHAAALKQVPSCEFFPIEAIKTNILGANNVILSAQEHNVEKVVVLSTDKAVYPINTMGMSKALMEKLMLASSRKEISDKSTTLCGVRYGNVMYSRGSVIPYFIDLMKQGKKLTVTKLGMTRFLLPLPYAVDLVLFALTEGKSGHIYVKKAPASTMETMAQSMCKLFGYKGGYEEVGIRNGEKMHESLISAEEMMRAVDLKEYYDIQPESQNLDYDTYFSDGNEIDVSKIEAYTSANAERLDLEGTIDLLMKLPEVNEEVANFGRK